MELFRPLAIANMLYILSIVPLLNYLIGIWYIIVSIVAISETQKISIGKAVAVVLIPIGILMVLAFVTAIVLITWGLAHSS